MDAPDRKSAQRTWVARVVLAALVVLVVLGLWQGYGMWLLGAAGAHAG